MKILLVVEESLALQARLSKKLGNSFEFICAAPEDALEELEERPNLDAAVVFVQDSEGFSLMKKMRELAGASFFLIGVSESPVLRSLMFSEGKADRSADPEKLPEVLYESF